MWWKGIQQARGVWCMKWEHQWFAFRHTICIIYLNSDHFLMAIKRVATFQEVAASQLSVSAMSESWLERLMMGVGGCGAADEEGSVTLGRQRNGRCSNQSIHPRILFFHTYSQYIVYLSCVYSSCKSEVVFEVLT